ncbi:MAG: diacylglycerol kinase [Bacteriovoracaceae bacterium]|nr:diacylglycerol kinase [Bacteriovoracaceae bacterium]
MGKKKYTFLNRLSFAWNGIRAAFKSEANFRIQLFLALVAIIILFVTQPDAIWWALILLSTASVLAAELANTSLEKALDKLHPEAHFLVGISKDCAAGAVLILSLGSLGVFIAFLFSLWNRSH